MALPQTACLALPGPLGPVLGTPTGRAWFDEEDEAEVQTAFALACGARYVLPVIPLLNRRKKQRGILKKTLWMVHVTLEDI